MSETINDYVKNNSKSDRQKHVDLTTPCIPSVLKRNYKLGKVGEYTTSRAGRINAGEVLKDYLQLSGSTSRKIHTCHLCDNSSTAPNGFVCVNPNHLYFGSALENNLDKPESVRKKVASKGGKAPSSQKQKETASKMGFEKATCPHCNKIGQKRVMKRWHFDNCKHRQKIIHSD